MTDLHWLTLSEVGRRIKSGELTSKAVTEHALNRIRATDDRYRAYVTVTADASSTGPLLLTALIVGSTLLTTTTVELVATPPSPSVTRTLTV